MVVEVDELKSIILFNYKLAPRKQKKAYETKVARGFGVLGFWGFGVLL